MKLTRRRLRQLILKEFKMMGDIGDGFDVGTGFPGEPKRGGGAGARIHQIVGNNESSDQPADYIAIPVDMGVFTKLRSLYDTLSDDSKNGLYAFTPTYDAADEGTVYRMLDIYIQLINGFKDHTDQLPGSYFYHVVFHPNYIAKESDVDKNLQIYKSVAGYTPDEGLLQEYELIMHSCSGLL